MKRSPFITPLSYARAVDILNSYGAAPERWPVKERQALVELLAKSEELQAVQETAGELDSLLDNWQPAATCDPADLIRSLPAQAPSKQNWSDQLTSLFFSRPISWQQGLLAGAPLVLGFIWGVSGDPSANDWSETEFLILNPPMEVITNE
jgi:hypothetical protein